MHIRYFEKRPGAWHLDFRGPQGQRLRPYGGPTEAAARKASAGTVMAALQGLSAPKVPAKAIVHAAVDGPTLKETFEKAMKVRPQWLQSKDKGTLETTYRSLGLDDRHPMALVTRDAVRDLLSKWVSEKGKRLGTKLAPSTVNSRLSMLSVLLEVADLAPHGVKHLSTKGNSRHRRITDQELAAMFAWAAESPMKDAPDFGRLMRVALETGGRLSEVLSIEVNGPLGTFRDTKNKLTRTVPLTEAAQRALEAPWPASLTVDRVGDLWDAMRASMGLASDTRFVFHLLRHECASRKADAGWGAHKIMALLGHESIKTSEGYVKISMAALAESMGVDLNQEKAA